MKGQPTPAVTPEMVTQLAALAELEIDADRVEAVAEQLGGLLGPASEVNRFIAGRRDVLPGVTVHHCGAENASQAQLEDQ